MENLYPGICRWSFEIPDHLKLPLECHFLQNAKIRVSRVYEIPGKILGSNIPSAAGCQRTARAERNGLYLFEGDGLSGAGGLPACFHDSDDTADLGDLNLGLGAAV